MAHYAILDENNIVTNIIVGKDESDPLPEGVNSWEEYYGGKRCSYNTTANTHMAGGTPFRGNYPSPGSKYDKDFDVFLPVQPYPSWKIDYDTFTWIPPVPKPEPSGGDDWNYKWSEVNKEWIRVKF